MIFLSKPRHKSKKGVKSIVNDIFQASNYSLDPFFLPTILIIASCGANYAPAGGMCVNNAKYAGFGGVIIDGPCRDISEIKESGLPFFAKGKCAKKFIGTNGQATLFSGAKDKNHLPIFINVKSGDIVFADVDGGVVLKKGMGLLMLQVCI